MGPENKPSFIDRARGFLEIQRGRSKWEYVGAGLKVAATAEGAWALTDFITGHPLEGSVKILSAIGIGIAGHLLHDRRNDLSKSESFIDRDGLPIFFTVVNIGITGLSLLQDRPVDGIIFVAGVVFTTEMYRRQVNINIVEESNR